MHFRVLTPARVWIGLAQCEGRFFVTAFAGKAGTPSKINPKKLGNTAEAESADAGDGVADHSCQATLRRTWRQAVIW